MKQLRNKFIHFQFHWRDVWFLFLYLVWFVWFVCFFFLFADKQWHRMNE